MVLNQRNLMTAATLEPKKEFPTSGSLLVEVINLHSRIVMFEAIDCPAAAADVRARLENKLREYRDALAQEREAA